VLFLSRIDPKKNLEALLRGFKVVTRDGLDAVLSIAGDGPAEYVSGLKALTQALSIESRVRWLGRVDGVAKAEAFSSAHVFVLPSWSENFGIAVVEAMLAGLPCVVGEGVGIAEDIERAGAGVVVLPEPGAIAAALLYVLDKEDRRRHMGQQARRLAEQEYSTAVMSERLIALYQEVSAFRRHPRR
jgi:glycosyltransferase involved in cell wall biosynthesis